MKKIKISLVLSILMMLFAGFTYAQPEISLTRNTSAMIVHPISITANFRQISSATIMDPDQHQLFITDGTVKNFYYNNPIYMYGFSFSDAVTGKTTAVRNLPTATSGPRTYPATEMDFPHYGYGITVYYVSPGNYSFTITEFPKP